MTDALAALTGLCAGIVSGGALCAFYIALGVFTKTAGSIGLQGGQMVYALASSAGGLFGAVITLFPFSVSLNRTAAAFFGLFAGIYVGIFIGCLADVISAIPVIRGYGIPGRHVGLAFIAFVAGKTAGAIIYWISGAF